MSETIAGKPILRIASEGPALGSEQDALDLIGATYGMDIEFIVLPVERLAPDFWTLRNGMAGAFIQKFTNYRLGLAFVGDLSVQTGRSAALADFVRESNRRRTVLFARNEDELAALLGARP